MRAFLLGGGLGSRLEPLTRSRPKCLVEVDGKPLLDHWLALLKREGVTEVLLNVSRFPELVDRHLRQHEGPPVVTLVVEDRPHGNAGTVRRNRAFVAGESSFWVLYSDNLTDCALGGLRHFHETHDGIVTLGLFHAPDPREAGVVDLDAAGRITSLVEKPAHPNNSLANAGIYLARPTLIDVIPEREDIVDFSLDVFPRCAGRMYGFLLDGFLADIGTLSGLERARRAWPLRGVAHQ